MGRIVREEASHLSCLIFYVMLALLCSFASQPAAADLLGVRSINGTGNNLADTSRGAANTRIIRFSYDAFYPNDAGVSTANESGATIVDTPIRPNARELSNDLFAQDARTPNARGLSDYIWQWGQFLTHDIDLTGTSSGNGTAHIPITDPTDPMGPNPIIFNRSNFDPTTGLAPGNPREQINEITSYIDASNVYGADALRADTLREMSGGRLKMTEDGLLIKNTAGLPNDDPLMKGADLFLAGDVRANEQVGLTSMHTIFSREHNRLAQAIASAGLETTDENIYQLARKIVGAQMQIITYNEFLPALMGPLAPSIEEYSNLGYLSGEDASITQTFSHAVFRFGHSMGTPSLQLRNNDYSLAGTLDLRDVFFAPELTDPGLGGDPTLIDKVLRGMAFQLAEENDVLLVDEIRNFLFGPPGAGGMDLGALDIQRGRDHGLPGYNDTRASYGLPRVNRVDQITSDTALQDALRDAYDLVDGDQSSFDELDLFVAALAEDHMAGSSLGITATVIIGNQFTRLRDGDRFFYLNDPDLYDKTTDGDTGDLVFTLRPEIAAIIDLDNVTLSQIITTNTGITGLHSNIFFIPEPASVFWLLSMTLPIITQYNKRATGQSKPSHLARRPPNH